MSVAPVCTNRIGFTNERHIVLSQSEEFIQCALGMQSCNTVMIALCLHSCVDFRKILYIEGGFFFLQSKRFSLQ